MQKILDYGPELSLNEVRQYLVPKLIKSSVRYVIITGGEPFIRSDIFHVMRILRDNGMKVIVYTNATLIDTYSKARNITALCEGMQISLDGPEDINDEVRGEGSFNKVIKALFLIQRAMDELGVKINIVINCVIHRYNYMRLAELIRALVKALGSYNISISYQFLEWKTPEMARDLEGKTWAIPICEELRRTNPEILWRQCKKVIKLGKEYGIRVSFHPLSWPFTLEDVKAWYYDSSYRASNHCLFIWDSVVMDPYGNIYPCRYFYTTQFNIKHTDLESAFHSKIFNKWRLTIRQRPLPPCTKCCMLKKRSYDRFLNIVTKTIK